jgi:hypothetical protein
MMAFLIVEQGLAKFRARRESISGIKGYGLENDSVHIRKNLGIHFRRPPHKQTILLFQL